MKIRRMFRIHAACLFLSILCGCASFFQSGPESVPTQSESVQEAQMQTLRLSAEKYRSLAVAAEKDQQLYRAAFLWLVLHRLMPEDPQARQKIAELEKSIHKGAHQHLRKGREHAGQKSFPAARNDFLMALAYDPARKDALDWLNNHPVNGGYTLYETKRGDTLKSVAQSVYQDAGKDFIVACFSGLKEDVFRSGMLLKLPVIESALTSPEPREPKPRYGPAPAPQLRPPKAYDKAAAEEHYRRGVGFFIAEDMQRAIREWEETLNLDPDHPNARRDIDKARKFLKNSRGK